jgi:hypothetical protein
LDRVNAGGQIADDSQSGTPYQGPGVERRTSCHTQKKSNDWIFTHPFARDGGTSDAATSD